MSPLRKENGELGFAHFDVKMSVRTKGGKAQQAGGDPCLKRSRGQCIGAEQQQKRFLRKQKVTRKQNMQKACRGRQLR